MQMTFALALVLVGTSALTALAILMFAGALGKPRIRATGAVTAAGDAAFLFDGQTLLDANQRGHRLLDSLHRTAGEDGTDWGRLTRHLLREFPDLTQALTDLPTTRHALLKGPDGRETDLRLDWVEGMQRLTLIDTLAEDASIVLDHIVLSGGDHGGVVDLKHHAASGGDRRLRERDGPGPEAFQQSAVMAVVGGDELGHHEDVVQIGE